MLFVLFPQVDGTVVDIDIVYYWELVEATQNQTLLQNFIK